MAPDTHIKNNENEILEEFRNKLKGEIEPEMYEDVHMFRRFLKAQNFNVNNAEAMLRKHLEWREKHHIKDISNYKKPEVIEKYYPHIFLGYDKEGCVIRYSPHGTIDFGGLTKCFKLEELQMYMNYETEIDGLYLKEQSKKLGRNIDQCVYIHNMEHLSFKQATDKKVIYLFINYIHTYENNCPEMMKAMFLINCSMYFTMAFNIIKKFISNSLLNRLHIYSDDSWKEDILKLVDANVLPAFLGGTKTDPDGNPLCLTFMKHGEPVPEKHYRNKSKKSVASMPDVKKISLANAAFHEEVLEIKEPGSYVEWEFETKCRDIGFGVFYAKVVDGKEEMIELIPHQRIDTEEYSETGTYLCEKTGKYVFLFDNSYSWIRSKEIYYRIKIVTPDEQELQLKGDGISV